MKKIRILLLSALAGFACLMANAQSKSEFYGLANRLGVSVGVGTTGITFDVSTCLTPYVGVRVGMDYFPNINFSGEFDLDYDDEMENKYTELSGKDLPSDIDVKGKTSMSTGHILFDIHPFKTKLRVTVGAYFGGSKIMSVYNTKDGALQDIYDYNHSLGDFAPLADNHPGKIGLTLGDYLIEPTPDGNAKAVLKTKSFRPYVGIGWGYAVPKKRLALQFDMGAQFWGSPKVYVQDKRLEEQDLKEDDGGLIKLISKVTFWPCVSLRLTGKIL